jgi:hypothetical protein
LRLRSKPAIWFFHFLHCHFFIAFRNMYPSFWTNMNQQIQSKSKRYTKLSRYKCSNQQQRSFIGQQLHEITYTTTMIVFDMIGPLIFVQMRFNAFQRNRSFLPVCYVEVENCSSSFSSMQWYITNIQNISKIICKIDLNRIVKLNKYT